MRSGGKTKSVSIKHTSIRRDRGGREDGHHHHHHGGKARLDVSELLDAIDVGDADFGNPVVVGAAGKEKGLGLGRAGRPPY